jgi:hypothetical protein
MINCLFLTIFFLNDLFSSGNTNLQAVHVALPGPSWKTDCDDRSRIMTDPKELSVHQVRHHLHTIDKVIWQT